MLIGTLSKKAGISKDTIRYYEKLGLINPEKRTRRENQYKEYTEDDLKVLYFIPLAKEYGFTLMEIKALMAGMKGNGDQLQGISVCARKKLGETEDKIISLLATKNKLLSLLSVLKA